MDTQCNPAQLEFPALGRRDVVGHFDGGRITSDGGGLLLREVDHRIGLLNRMANGFTDHRNPNSIEHSVHSLVAQRVYGLALGYGDLNDHDVLRADSVLALLVAKQDLTGEHREREQDRGNPLAGSSTLNRLELSDSVSATTDRYKKIAANPAALDRQLVDLFIESCEKALREIRLDLDATRCARSGCPSRRPTLTPVTLPGSRPTCADTRPERHLDRSHCSKTSVR
ncbi:MAG: transposase [Parahaliea sp.]